MPFDKKISLLRLTETEAGSYAWTEAEKLWAEVKATGKTTIFSKVGLSAQAVQFTMCRRTLRLEDAFFWQGRHYFLTAVAPKGVLYVEVTAAPVDIAACRAVRTVIKKNARNNPVTEEITPCRFPGCLTEKYMGYEQKRAEAVSQITYVLVTPKVIALETGDLVYIDEVPFEVRLAHVLDGYKNEYEVYRKKEA